MVTPEPIESRTTGEALVAVDAVSLNYRDNLIRCREIAPQKWK